MYNNYIEYFKEHTIESINALFYKPIEWIINSEKNIISADYHGYSFEIAAVNIKEDINLQSFNFKTKFKDLEYSQNFSFVDNFEEFKVLKQLYFSICDQYHIPLNEIIERNKNQCKPFNYIGNIKHLHFIEGNENDKTDKHYNNHENSIDYIDNKNPKNCYCCAMPITNGISLTVKYNIINLYGQECTEILIYGIDTYKFQTVYIVNDPEMYFESYTYNMNFLEHLKNVKIKSKYKFIDIFGTGNDAANFKRLYRAIKKLDKIQKYENRKQQKL